jgi:hypothetical protein
VARMIVAIVVMTVPMMMVVAFVGVGCEDEG